MSRQKYGSKNYYKTLHKYWKWIDKRNNIVEDFLHKLSYTIVMNHQSIFMETLNIKGMMQNENFAAKLQAISISKFISMMEYKCHWNQRNFIQVSMFFPSSKMCNICKEKYEELKQHPDDVFDILKEGADKVRPIAQEGIQIIRSKIGINR